METYKEIFGEVEDRHRFLYHYTTPKAALGGILPLHRLRASPRAWLNDPLENERLSPAFLLSGSDTTDPKKWGRVRPAVEAEFEKEISLYIKILCFTMDLKGTKSHRTIEGRGFGHSAMWEHYADGHRGVCLILDKAKLESEIRQSWKESRCGEVKYKDVGHGMRDGNERVDVEVMSLSRVETIGPSAAVTEHISKNFEPLFLTKLADWSHESEFRWVTRSETFGPEFVSISESLEGVVAGARFAELDHRVLEEQLSSYNSMIPIAKLRFVGGAPVVSECL